MLARCKRQEGSDGELGVRGGGRGVGGVLGDVTFCLYMREPERMGTAAWFYVSAEFSQCFTFAARLDENGAEKADQGHEKVPGVSTNQAAPLHIRKKNKKEKKTTRQLALFLHPSVNIFFFNILYYREGNGKGSRRGVTSLRAISAPVEKWRKQKKKKIHFAFFSGEMCYIRKENAIVVAFQLIYYYLHFFYSSVYPKLERKLRNKFYWHH